MPAFICQLEMERALLEGEHQTELEHLQEDQERIRALKQRQLDLIECAASEKDKVRVWLGVGLGKGTVFTDCR